jgi:hypothetical protein
MPTSTFLAPPGGELTRSAMAEATRYHVLPPDPVFDEEETAARPADQALVGNVLNPNQVQIVYEYVFGDSWDHLVRVEERSRGGDPAHVPTCLAGENAAPIDDMGGIGGYYQWLEALRNESDDMHEDALQWLGKDFDPTHFDLKAANKALAVTFKPAPRKPRKKRKKKD